MNYLMVDISGKVLNYDIALCEALSKVLPSSDHLLFLAPKIEPEKINCDCRRLISLIPRFLTNSENIVKRGIKALEGVANYIYLVLYLFFHKVGILHLQWLPFLEISSIERYVLKTIRFISPRTKIFLTVHNLYPHNSSESRRIAYRNRFSKVQRCIDKYILHLEVSRKEFCQIFSIDESRTIVIPHGIFEPKGYIVRSHKCSEKLNLIMYGNQSYYKGTDILVDALNLLPRDCQEKIHTTIVGKIALDYYGSLKNKAKTINVEWIPEFVSNDILYKKIEESDVIVIPYREISQSGVLLLALSFKRAIIASDLPSFRETLSGIGKEFFFKTGSAESLAKSIEWSVNHPTKLDDFACSTENLLDCYSWNSIAERYLSEFNTKDKLV